MSLLEIDDINTFYGESQALHDLSLEVDQGDVVTILGRNGAGKTTTLRSIVGIAPPRTGTIRYDGEDVTGEETYDIIRRGIGYVPEDRQVWTQLTVHENLAVPAGRGGDRTIEDIYELFPKLEELSNAKAGTMSGGEQQMLAIGRGLLGGTELLLLDEPTEGLAPLIVEDVRDAILRLKEELTIVLVEQNVKMALEVADHVFVVSNGRNVYESTTDGLDPDDEVLKEHVAV
jgi:branched-chain amino acid transport system ATP-binding protein